MLQLFIPTLGRATTAQQTTLTALNNAMLPPRLVVQAHEWERYSHLPVRIDILPPEIKTIAPTRQYILDHLVTEKYFCMLDDDLTFYHRRAEDRTKLRDITDWELQEAFREMESTLEYDSPHVGFIAREGANRTADEGACILNTRIMRVLGYSTEILREEEIRFDRLEVMEDFDVALQLLRKGYSNTLLNNYAQNQAGSGKSGGCSTFRTPELHARNAQRLAELHPKYVTVVDKETKGAWGGGVRKDVRIQWKRAYHE